MKENGFELSLLSLGTAPPSGLVGIICGTGWITAIIALLGAVLVTFTRVGFIGGFNDDVSATVIALLLASYLIYFSMQSVGESLGKRGAEYSAALKEYEKAVEGIRPEDVYELRSFCTKYAEDELAFRREGRLMRHGLCYRDFLQYLDGVKPNHGEWILRSVSRMKPRTLTPQMLLTFEGTGGELSPPYLRRAVDVILKLLPTTVCTFFTGMIVLGLKDGLTAEAVIEGIVKLSALPVIALKGCAAGYSYAKGPLAVWLGTKAKLLIAFSKKVGKEERL